MIELENVGFSYRDGEENAITALNGVTLDFAKGEFTAVLGRNGSGKSTLAKLLNALLLPTEGRVLVFGADTADENELFGIRKSVGIVFQNPDNQTVASIVEDDAAFGPENLGLPREEIIRRVDWALKAVGMEEYRFASSSGMSGGQKQRAAIAGILAMKPKVIVFDESTSMLDPSGRKEVMSVIRKLTGEGLGAILITHDMGEAADADRVVVLDGGAVVADGTPREVFSGADVGAYNLKLPLAAAIAKRLEDGGIRTDGAFTEAELTEAIYRALK
ncbi:MAG: energy-coupling factor transporter ATPase [Clostridiales bacterium]|jgi:energy-coupling factor transport system ATP-binding protein|nr:energy-coupling factor transporter ATPase [Clostridiales bacterium]